MRRVPLFGCCVAFLGLLLPASSADADPVVIGTFEVHGRVPAVGSGSFSNGDITLSVGDSGFLDAAARCDLCRAGTELSFSGRFSDLDGFVEFTSPAFVLPHVAPGVSWTIAMPFSFFGTSWNVSTGTQLGSLGGLGIVTGTFGTQLVERDGILLEDTFFYFRHATFVAGAEPSAPVPEPASVLLIASGLGGLCAWRRRSAKET